MDNLLLVYGYHGTSQTKAADILQHGFLTRDNDYDWLGTGIYFFQDAPIRAKQWATQQHPNNPAVIFALIKLENCIDLFDVGWQPLLKNMCNLFTERRRSMNRPLPKQNPDRSKAHRLDCAFLNFAHELMLSQGQSIAPLAPLAIDSIRAAFIEGERIFPDSAIFDLTHVQIAIRNPTLIQECYLVEI
jgi:hypothetical protein